MKVEVRTETDAEGVRIASRYEDGQLVRVFRSRKLPSGKQELTICDGAGNKVQEIHSHDTLIMLTIGFGRDGKSESYIVKKRLASREKYEQARIAYPDMPAADLNLADLNAELLKLVKTTQSRKRLERKAHEPDKARGLRSDEFCLKLLQSDQIADAHEWIKRAKNSLGEMSSTSSKRLLAKLNEHGCTKIWVCEIDRATPAAENSSHVVIELPLESAQRSSIFKLEAKFARKQGFDPAPDDGQRFLFLKFD